MDAVTLFKQILDGFFTKEHCNNWLHEEKDFQRKVSEYLVANGYQVLREVEVKKEDIPAIEEELGQNYMFIDVVAYKGGFFFPIELKFENVNHQERHLTSNSYEEDGVKTRLLFDNYMDIPVSRTRVLTNNHSVRKTFKGEWHALLDGQSGDEEFMWQWHWWHDEVRKRNPQHYFIGIWNATVIKRYEEGFKEGESAKCIV